MMSRRNLILGAPAVVLASSLMPISALKLDPLTYYRWSDAQFRWLPITKKIFDSFVPTPLNSSHVGTLYTNLALEHVEYPITKARFLFAAMKPNRHPSEYDYLNKVSAPLIWRSALLWRRK